MIRNKKISAIMISDIHIRENRPRCRTDNFFKAQENKIDFIFDLARKNDCPIFVGGDIGDKPKWSCKLLKWFISKITDDIKIFVIPGQHDLLNHRLDLWEHSAVGVLHASDKITLLGPDNLKSYLEFDDFCLHAFPYGNEISHKKINSSKRQIAITHQMIIENKTLWPGQTAPKGHQILKKYSEYDLILSGDNHNSFVSIDNDRKLVNPGSMMRNNADQELHRPRIFLWDAKTNGVESVYLPIDQNVISRTHIDLKNDREKRNEAFIRRVNNMENIVLSFEENIKRYFEENRTSKKVKDKTWTALEG
jgi:DNA repair exonuclease SbcCD nuclease subunit